MKISEAKGNIDVPSVMRAEVEKAIIKMTGGKKLDQLALPWK